MYKKEGSERGAIDRTDQEGGWIFCRSRYAGVERLRRSTLGTRARTFGAAGQEDFGNQGEEMLSQAICS